LNFLQVRVRSKRILTPYQKRNQNPQTHQLTRSDVSIYGERQMLLRFFQISFIINFVCAFPVFPLSWSGDDGCVVCFNPKNKQSEKRTVRVHIVTKLLHHSGARTCKNRNKKKTLLISMVGEDEAIKITNTWNVAELYFENTMSSTFHSFVWWWKFLICWVNMDLMGERWEMMEQ
jgi:hypothetical protein